MGSVFLRGASGIGSAVVFCCSLCGWNRLVLRSLAQWLGKLSYPLELSCLLSEVDLKVVVLLQVSVRPCSFESWCHEMYESCRTSVFFLYHFPKDPGFAPMTGWWFRICETDNFDWVVLNTSLLIVVCFAIMPF